jgi:hypothetical protein
VRLGGACRQLSRWVGRGIKAHAEGSVPSADELERFVLQRDPRPTVCSRRSQVRRLRLRNTAHGSEGSSTRDQSWSDACLARCANTHRQQLRRRVISQVSPRAFVAFGLHPSTHRSTNRKLGHCHGCVRWLCRRQNYSSSREIGRSALVSDCSTVVLAGCDENAMASHSWDKLVRFRTDRVVDPQCGVGVHHFRESRSHPRTLWLTCRVPP